MAQSTKTAEDISVMSYRVFPDPLASAEEKLTDRYGLSMAKLIEYEWFYIQDSNEYSSFFNKRLNFDRLRRYARGEQDTTLLKKLITDGTDGDSYTNYDFRPIQILPKFIKLVVDQMVERLYEIDAQAIDGVSQGLRDDFRDILEKNMVAKGMLQDGKDLLNIDLMPADDIPDSAEELELHMKLRYKPNIEVAIEEALKYTLQLNDYPELQRQVLYDLVTIGISCLFQTTDPTKGIEIKYRDPADMVWSYPEYSNFRNVYYYGHVERMTINELQRKAGLKFSDDQLQDFANVSNGWAGYNRISNQFWYRGEDLPNHMVDVLHFTFESTRRKRYKKKYRKNGSFTLTEKDLTFEKSEDQLAKEKAQGFPDFDIVDDVIPIWYEGSLVLGSDMIFNYGECKNMVRPDGFINRAMSNYVMYAPELYQGRVKSLVDRTITMVDQLGQLRIKIQQFISKAKPNGIAIDIDGLQEISMGEGQFFEPLDLVRYYDDTGNLLYTSRLADGGWQGTIPIKELNNGSIAGLEQLMNAYNFHLALFRDRFGIGQGADGTLPDPRVSAEAQKQAAQGSNVATRYVLEGMLKMTQYVCTGLSLRLKDIFRYSNLKNAYINSIGKINVDVIESLKDLHLHDFGIAVKLKPDAEERQLLEANIQAEITAGGISTTDGMDIRKIGNLTLANEMLKIRKKKHEALVHQRDMEKIKQQSDGIVAQTTAAKESKLEEIAAQKEADLEVEDRKGDKVLQRIKAEKEANMELMEAEYFLKTGEAVALAELKQKGEDSKEDRKDKRTAIQASQQSRMKQADEADDPIDFTTEYSNMNGELNTNSFRV